MFEHWQVYDQVSLPIGRFPSRHQIFGQLCTPNLQKCHGAHCTHGPLRLDKDAGDDNSAICLPSRPAPDHSGNSHSGIQVSSGDICRQVHCDARTQNQQQDTNVDSTRYLQPPMQAVRLSLKRRARETGLSCLGIPSTASVMPFPQGPYVEATAEPYRVKIRTPISSAKKAATNLTLATPLSVLCRRPGILACDVDR